jgi:hypothetical protein
MGMTADEECKFAKNGHLYTILVLLIFWTLPIVPYAKAHGVSETRSVSVLM